MAGHSPCPAHEKEKSQVHFILRTGTLLRLTARPSARDSVKSTYFEPLTNKLAPVFPGSKVFQIH